MYPSQKSGVCPIRAAGQRGFSIVSAIFLLLVLAALGAFILTFSSAQHTTSAQDVEGSRAYQAARAGIEWGVYQVLRVPPPPAAAPACFASPTTVASPATVPLGSTLAGFTVVASCNLSTHTEAGVTVTIYRITSTASKGAQAAQLRVERQLQSTVAR